MPKPFAMVTKDHDVRAHAYLWHASKCLLERGQEQEKASRQQFMASMVFTAFALEAYLNWLGDKLFLDWGAFEKKLNLKEKLKKIAKQLQMNVNMASEPWAVITKLFQFRNDIAHGKPEQKKEEKKEPIDDHLDGKLGESAETDWQKFCTQENAERAREDVKKMAQAIHDAAIAAGGLMDSSGPFDFGMQFCKAVYQSGTK
jgi:hypothetical protein